MSRFQKSFDHVLNRLFSLSYQQIFLVSIGNIAFFTVLFFLLSYIPGFSVPGVDALPLHERLAVLWHYSTSLASNTGVGDMGTTLTYKLLASFEMIIGIFLFAFVIAKFTSRNTDKVLKSMYEMQLETTYRNVYEELYIARKRFDAITERSQTKRHLDDENALLLRLTCTEVSSSLIVAPQLLLSIGADSELDRNRQEVLSAIIRRTLHRLSSTLHTLSEFPDQSWKSEDMVAHIAHSLRSYHRMYRTVAAVVTEQNKDCVAYLESALDIVCELEQALGIKHI